MKSSLTLKLIAAFAGVCILEALLVAFLIREVSQRSFDDFLREEAIEVFANDIRAHYAQTGSWDGVMGTLRGQGGKGPPLRRRPPPAMPPGEANRMGERRRPPAGKNPRFGLANSEGEVIISNGVHDVGEILSATDLSEGIPLAINGEARGTMLLPAERMALSEREAEYLRRVEGSLIWASLGVALLAVMLGIWLARGYTRPIKELTAASRALAGGELGRQVAVTSNDEVGELSESFNRMSAQLEEVSAQRRQMTADIAHDLRTPLTVLSGYLEALRNEELKPTPERFELLYNEAIHLSRLVDDLRVLALADAGELKLNMQPADVIYLLESVSEIFQNRAKKAGIMLGVAADESLEHTTMDADRMRQVLTNLVGNALRYTPDGGRITLRALENRGKLQIDIADTGTGIPAEALPHLFDRFYRVDDSRHRTKGETGLGLAIAKSLVEAHGGTLSVTSVEGEGSTFTLVIPK